MIKAIVGEIGSGKTLSAVRHIIVNKKTTLVNFDVKSKNIIRLRKDNFIKETVIGVKKSGEEVKKLELNWEYWQNLLKEHPEGFDIVGDEWHNIMHSRQSMSKWNTLMSMFMAQVRKIMGSNEKNDFIFITQVLDRVDVSVRDLLAEIIVCKKIQYKHIEAIETPIIKDGKKTTRKIPLTTIHQYHFKGTGCYERALAFIQMGVKTYNSHDGFIANPFMQYYDSYSFVTFGDDVYV